MKVVNVVRNGVDRYPRRSPRDVVRVRRDAKDANVVVFTVVVTRLLNPRLNVALVANDAKLVRKDERDANVVKPIAVNPSLLPRDADAYPKLSAPPVANAVKPVVRVRKDANVVKQTVLLSHHRNP